MEKKMTDLSIKDMQDKLYHALRHGGVFLTAGQGEKANTMTVGWGGLTEFFGRKDWGGQSDALCGRVFLAPIRKSRHTFHLVEEGGVFTVSIPLHDMKKELAYAGTRSGKNENKWDGHGLTPIPAQCMDTMVVGECELFLECRVVAKAAMTPDQMDEGLRQRFYADSDMHSLFLGEIIACYSLA